MDGELINVQVFLKTEVSCRQAIDASGVVYAETGIISCIKDSSVRTLIRATDFLLRHCVYRVTLLTMGRV